MEKYFGAGGILLKSIVVKLFWKLDKWLEW